MLKTVDLYCRRVTFANILVVDWVVKYMEYSIFSFPGKIEVVEIPQTSVSTEYIVNRRQSWILIDPER